MRCMMCGLDPATATGPAAVYRLNNKGQKGVWACKAHYDEAKARYFPKDDPNAPAPMKAGWDSEPLGPWTGGTMPVPPKT